MAAPCGALDADFNRAALDGAPLAIAYDEKPLPDGFSGDPAVYDARRGVDLARGPVKLHVSGTMVCDRALVQDLGRLLRSAQRENRFPVLEFAAAPEGSVAALNDDDPLWRRRPLPVPGWVDEYAASVDMTSSASESFLALEWSVTRRFSGYGAVGRSYFRLSVSGFGQDEGTRLRRQLLEASRAFVGGSSMISLRTNEGMRCAVRSLMPPLRDDAPAISPTPPAEEGPTVIVPSPFDSRSAPGGR